MRTVLTLLFVLFLCTCGRAQVTEGVRAQLVDWCMVDSLNNGEVVRFRRVLLIGSVSVDLDQDGDFYVPAGSVYTCDAYDALLANRVLNLAGHQGVRGIIVDLDADTYNSVSIIVTEGPVAVTIDGVQINYPTGWTTSWSAREGQLIQNTIRVDTKDEGEAVISYMR